MKEYGVRITETAMHDLQGIFEYIAYELLSPVTARKQVEKIEKAIRSLTAFPERFPLMSAIAEEYRGLRGMQVDNYLVVYVVENDEVTIYKTVFGGSDIPTMLMDNRMGE